MSGICAVWWKGNPTGAAATLTSMNAGLSLNGSEEGAEENDQGAGVAVSALFAEQQIYRDGRILLACDAELINEGGFGPIDRP